MSDKNKQHNNRDFIFTALNPDNKNNNIDLEAIGAFVRNEFVRYRSARQPKEDIWTECWAVYNGSPEALKYTQRLAARTVGEVATEWRHKISPGKAFENVETINSYLQSAFFPNRDWFDLVPMYSGSSEVADVVKKFLKTKLKQAQFRTHWDMFTRQLLITGTSVLALPWRKEVIPQLKRVRVEYPLQDETGKEIGKNTRFETKVIQKQIYNGAEFETLSMFDCFFDPDETTDINRANFIRRLVKNKGELMRLINNGFYPHLDPLDVVKHKNNNNNNSLSESKKRTVATFHGINWYPTDLVEIIEFWGNVQTRDGYYEDTIVTCLGDKVARFENNPYWGGKPFVVGTYTPVPNQIYGLGCIEPVLGLLHELSIVTNQRLDNLELSLDTMWTCVDDGTLNVEDVFTAPGKIIEVADHNSLRPLQHNQQFVVSYQESGLLEQTIDKTSGTGAFIGVGQGRGGERVTAQEVQAVRDAGGNRLGNIHRHIEQTALHLTLKKLYRSCQQFVTEDEIIRIPGFQPGEYLYVQVGMEELVHDFDIEVVGAGHIADKEYELQKRLDFINLVGGNSVMAEQLDWTEVMKDLAKRFGFDDLDRFIKKQQTPAPEMPQLPPEAAAMLPPEDAAAVMDAAWRTGGKPGQDRALAELLKDGGQSALEQTMDTLGVSLNDEQQQQ